MKQNDKSIIFPIAQQNQDKFIIYNFITSLTRQKHDFSVPGYFLYVDQRKREFFLLRIKE